MSQKEGHSIMDGISYRKFEKASYLNSPIFNIESSQLILALRTRTVRGIKNEFRGMFTFIKRPLKCGENDIVQHILECPTKTSDSSLSTAAGNKSASTEQPARGSDWFPWIVYDCKSVSTLSMYFMYCYLLMDFWEIL